MFWHKKSIPAQPIKEPDTYIKFYIADDDLRVEFAYENISEMIVVSDAILNGKMRNKSIETIYSKIFEAGLVEDSNRFAAKINKTIKPSEYQP